MTKQTNYIGFILTKALAFFLISIALVFVYSEVKRYNVALSIKWLDYEISTYVGFIIFVFLSIMALLFTINGIIAAVIGGFEAYKEKYKGSKINSAISSLVESAVLLSLGSKKEASAKLASIDKKYLTNEQQDYTELLENMTSSESLPIALYGYTHKYPFIKNQLSKKLAVIEFKLGNFEKALEYARQYYSQGVYDEEAGIIMAKIYAIKLDWKSMDGAIASMSSHEISSGGKESLSVLYLAAGKDCLSNAKNSDVLSYCSKALELKPDNIDAAELFAEVAISQKKYDLVHLCLIKAFAAKPNFLLFLIIKKFSSLSSQELYQQLSESCNTGSYSDLFLSIAIILELPERQKEIIEQIS